jgi:thioredoxin-dependent peroxiredoxin
LGIQANFWENAIDLAGFLGIVGSFGKTRCACIAGIGARCWGMLVPGDIAPDFHAAVIGGSYSDGAEVQLSALRGRTVILYFYPKDDTPGCTEQACSLRDHYGYVIEKGAEVFGVSVDSVDSHLAFIEKHSLPFPLISDEKKEIVQAYGVWVEKSMYGKKYMGVERSTFVVGPKGTIKSIFRKVKPAEHTETLLEDLRHFEP